MLSPGVAEGAAWFDCPKLNVEDCVVTGTELEPPNENADVVVAGADDFCPNNGNDGVAAGCGVAFCPKPEKLEDSTAG